MHFADNPELDVPDPYGGTPLGVEAAWCPNGIDAQLPAATESAPRPMRPLQ